MSTVSKKQSREDFRKQKELEEARKAGTAPAEVDEDGKDINPHIPQYITVVPWYLNIDHATLKHQRQDDDKIERTAPLDEFNRVRKGVKKEQKAPRKFKKGACENCGATTHKKKHCVERPRKHSAKQTKSNIARDEFIQELDPNLGYAGRHDRWRNYNPAQYQRVIDEYAKIEEEKRRIKEESLKAAVFEKREKREKKEKDPDDTDSEDSDADEEDEDKYGDKANAIAKFDAKNRVSVRNLRIREDRAKYLYNLDLNSAHYDSKTRTMRTDPLKDTDRKGKSAFVGDNFIRYNDDTHEINKRQMFAWDVTTKGEDLHLQADPTLAEMMHKQHKTAKETFKTNQSEGVLAKYGGEEYLKVPPKELLIAQSEHYTEYSKAGRLLKGAEESIVRSKYEEDQYPGNHRTIWGSFWRDGRWGFACCHQFVREAYCTGEAGKLVSAQAGLKSLGYEDAEEGEPQEAPKSMVEEHLAKQAEEKKSGKKTKRGDDEEEEDESEEGRARKRKRIKEIMKRQEREEKAAAETLQLDERDRKYGAMGKATEKPSEEEMEAYRLRQTKADDPMANFGDDLL